MDGKEKAPWKRPPIESRSSFLEGMRALANVEQDDESDERREVEIVEPIRSLMDSGKLNEAFFLARRRAAEGDMEAEQLMNEISEAMK